MAGEAEAAQWAAETWQQWPGATVPVGPLQRYRARWVAWWLNRAADSGEVPVFGSQEWADLPPDDPRKTASAIRAADAWAREGDDLAFRMAADEYNRRAADDAYWRAAHAERGALVEAITDRARALDSRAARTAQEVGEYRGGAVDWETGRPVSEAEAA